MKEKIRLVQNFKKWMCGVLLFVMVLAAALLVKSADAKATSGVLNVDTSVGWSLGGTSYGTEGLMTINGDVVYCLERLKTYYSGMTYTGSEDFSSLGFSSSTKEKLSLLAYYGSQRAKSTGNVDWYAVVGSAIWAETGQDRGWILSPTFNTDEKVKSAIQTLQGDVSQYYVKPSFQGNATVKVGKTIYLTDANDVLSTYTVKSTDGLSVKIDGDILAITGTSNAEDISTITLEKKISASDVGISIMYDAGADVQKIGAFKVSAPISDKVTVNVEKHGNLQITKKDNKGNVVPNTQFKVSYNSDMSNPIGTYTTGSDGTVTIQSLNSVNVYIQEVSVPEHLVLNSAIKRIGITANGTAYYTATNNWVQGKVQVVKKDAATGKIIMKSGAVFDVYDSSDTKVDTITTNDNGVATSKLLDYGTYYVKETKAPDGYLLDAEPITFKISDAEGVVINKSDVSVKGQITIEKRGEFLVDFKNGQFIYENRAMANIKFNIIAKENIMDPSNDGTVLYTKGSVVETLTTGADGKAVSSKLPLGIYEVVETETLAGLVLSEKQEVRLNYADEITPVVFKAASVLNERQKVHLNLNKLDSDENIPLEGVEFTLYANKDIKNCDGNVILAKDEVVAVTTSDKDGNITFAIELPVDLDSNTTSVGGSFASTTDANGNILIGNVNSMFRMKETKGLIGYVSPNTILYLDTTYQGQNLKEFTISYDLYNEITHVVVSKTDITTGEPVIGAELSIIPLDKDGNPKVEGNFVTWITEADDPNTKEDESLYHIKGLEPGDYILRETLGQASVFGYVTATDVMFTVADTGEIQKVEMKDDYTKVEISKVDTDGNFVEGATLQIVPLDENGMPLMGEAFVTWLTGKEAYQIQKLPIGRYMLIELSASEGYEVAEAMIIEIMDTDDVQSFTMIDEFILTDIQVNKVDSVTKKPILSKDFVFGLYADKECTKLITTVHANTTDGTATFEDLRYGTYYIKEIEAPKGYQLSKEVKEIIINDNLEGVGEVHSFVYENILLPATTVNTGDNTFVLPLVVSLISALIGIGFIIMSKKKRLKGETKDEKNCRVKMG